MIRSFAIAAGVVALCGIPATADADPVEQDGSTFAIGKCYDPGKPPIVVHAWNPVTSPSAECPRGVKFYTDMTIAYPEGTPPWITPGTTWSPGTDFVIVGGMPAVHYSELTPTCGPL